MASARNAIFAAVMQFVFLLVGCGTSTSRQAGPEDRFGTVSADLAAIGPDGATYGFAPPAALTLSSTASGGFGQTYPLQGNFGAPTMSLSLPAGTYTATLAGGDAGEFALVRLGDAAITHVPAILEDAQPYSFVVQPGMTTSLTFHFLIPGLGVVTFSNGTLTTALSVEAGTVLPSSGTLSGVATLTDLSNALGAPGPVPYGLTLQIQKTWTAEADQACARVTAHATNPPPLMSSSQALANTVLELDGATGQICFGDPNVPGFQLTLARSGAPITPGVQLAFPTAANVAGTFTGGTSPPIYDGTTLSLDALASGAMLVGPVVTIQFGDANLQLLGQVSSASSATSADVATLTLAP